MTLRAHNRIRTAAIAAFSLLLAVIITAMPCPKIVHATELVPVVPAIPFALIEHSSVTLYQKDTTNQFYPVTTLPRSYFVAVTEDYNAEYCRVLYRDLYGFVKKADVTMVDYEPVTKDILGKLLVTVDASGVYLRERPDHLAENVLKELPRGQSLSYYGTLHGTSPIAGGSDVWYYVITADGERGYLYAPYVTASPIAENVIEKVMREPDPPSPSHPYEPPDLALDPLLTTLLIAALCTPCVIVMMLLFQKPKPPKREPRR